MTHIPDDAVRRLKQVAELPDLGNPRYDVVDVIGRGGMGVVFRARDRELDRDVAIKVLSTPEHTEDTSNRMRSEARILARLEHPGIVPVHDVGAIDDGRVYYAMKLVSGQQLDDYAREKDDYNDMLRVLMKVCETVAFAHSHNIVHRDLKPQNIMVGEFGEVLVLDWGVAKLLGNFVDEIADAKAATVVSQPPAGEATKTGTVMGTYGYMSPEQERGDQSRIDRRSDVYAIGAMLRHLDDAYASRHGDYKTPRRLNAIIEKAMDQSPAGRYQTAALLSRDIARFMTGDRVGAYEETTLEKLMRWASRHKTPIALIFAYVLMRILLFLINRV